MKTQGNYRRLKLALGLFLMMSMAISSVGQSTYRITESYLNNSGKINYIKPDDSWANTTNEDLPEVLQSLYGLTFKPELEIMKETISDRFHFQRFEQMYGEAYVYGGDIIVKRDKSGKILAIVGTMRDVSALSNGPVISKDTAVVRGIHQVGSDKPFMWYNQAEQDKLKWLEDDTNATYYPTAKLVYYPRLQEPFRDYVLCYEMEIYTLEPARYFTYVNAATGALEHHYNGIAHASSAGTTLYNGNKNFNTGKIGRFWHLHDSVRKIYTVDGRGTDSLIWQVRDGNNNFDANWQKEGVSAHWACGKALDYYKAKFNRKSLDGKGSKVMQTVRYDSAYNNAFWSGKAMYYGSGNGTNWGPLVAVDDVGHESSHGTIQFAAGLIYQGESGALNEGWADIFGMTIENYTGDKDWNQSEDSYTPGTANDALRVMNNPNTTRDPDSYKGKYWKSTAIGARDDGGVHSNSGVANFWFFLLTDGGNGKSDGKGGQVDMGNNYSVTGIGIAKSEQIAYRALENYMAKSTDYAGARVATLLAAEDLYGKNSNEYKQVCNAWYAVDVGEKCCPDSMEFEFTFTEPKCFDSKDGKIDLTVKKATGPFVFEWYKNDTLGPKISSAEDLNGVEKGIYIVIVKDTAAKCEKMEKVELKGPTEVKVSISGGGIHIRACDRKPEIYLQATASGGTSPYSYNWPSGKKVIATSGSVGNSGWYTAVATDKNGCKGGRTTFAFFIPIRCSYDPNDIIGPPAYGDEKWVSVKATLPYKIRFENDPKFATAPAQRVTIDHPLDSNVDLASFRLSDFGFANYVFEVPKNSSYYSKRLDLRDSLGIYLDVTAGLNTGAKKAFWIFESIDPATGLPPADANVGFLAVNDTNTHVGEGFVDYTIKPKPTAVTGDSIRAIAEIVFDNNPSLFTPKIHNLIDAVAPTSGIKPLPGLLDSVNIPLTFYGEDDSAASGFGAWDLYVSENGGAYTLYGQGLTDSVLTYRGNYGTEYKFYTLGLDNVSNKEASKTVADVTVTIAPDQFLRDLDSNISLCALDTLEIKWNALSIPSFDLEYTADSGATFVSVAKNLNPADSVYSWIVPSSIQLKKDYWIRAVASSSQTPIDTTRFFELKAIPSIDLGTDTSFCAGTAINMVINSGGGYSSYLWTTSATTSSITATAAGTYGLTVSNAYGCENSDELKIGTYMLPEVASKVVSDASCNGASDGTVDLTIVSGNAPYVYTWNSGDSTQDVSGKTAGTYIVTVTDSVLCSVRDTSVISEPAVLASTPSLVHVSCFGGSDAEIDLNTSGGTASFSYVWSNSDTTEKVTGLSKGTYTVITTDTNNCVRYDTLTITEPDVLASSVTTSNVSCYDSSDGSINLSVTGGTTAYSYAWSNGDTTQDISGLMDGTFTVIITDAKGCLAYDTAQVTEPTQLQLSATITNVSCNAGSDGEVDLTVTGGTPGYVYDWDNTATTQDISSLDADTYIVVVSDTNKCVVRDTFVVTEPTPMRIKDSVTHVSCNAGSDGEVDLTVTGGTPGYTFLWSNSETTEDITSLEDGRYTVEVKDANGCEIKDTAVVTEPTAIVSSGVLTMVDCYGDTSGAVNLTVTGGTPGYTFLWNNNDTTEDLTTIGAGTYHVAITDTNSCVHRDTFVITQPTQLQSSTVVTDISCFGLTDGAISLTVSGGSTGYKYDWSNGDATATITGLAKGQYTVIITDANGCKWYDTATVAEPTPLTISHTVAQVSCNSGSDGGVDVTISGGTPGYDFLWNNTSADVTEDITMQTEGTYIVVVADDNGCEIRDTATITEPAKLESSATLDMVKCFNGSDAAIDLTVIGGTKSYTFLWSNSSTSEDLTGVASGVYSVVITDANACEHKDTFTITQPTIIQSTEVITDVTCFGLTDGAIAINVSGGVMPYDYLWSDGDTNATNLDLAAGTYSVIVTDSNACEYYDTLVVSEPNLLTLSEIANPVSCNLGNDGSIDLTVSGGTPKYKFVWSTTDLTEDLSGLTAGIYSVIVTDSNSCQAFDTITISEPMALVLSKLPQNLKCNSDSSGAVDLGISGGTPGYDVLWSNGATTEDISNLPADTYSVVVTDANNCVAYDTATLTQPDSLKGTLLPTDLACFGDANGSVDLTVTGGTQPYVFDWSNGDTTEDITGLSGGEFSVIITDTNNCVWHDTAQVFEPTEILLDLDSIGEHVGKNDGKAWVTVQGGVGPYQYLWNDPSSSTTDTASNLSLGVYTVTVTDANGCEKTDSIDVPSLVGTGGVILPHEVMIYPNPNQGSVGIYNLGVLGDDVRLIVTDSRGRTIIEKSVRGELNHQLQLPSTMVDGTYLISLFGESLTVHKKMILIW